MKAMSVTAEKILENLPGAAIICDVSGERKIFYASEGIAKLFGFETALGCLRYFGYSHQLLIYAEDEEKTSNSIWRQIETSGGSFFVTHRVILPDQRFKTIAQCGRLVKEKDSEACFYIYLYDMQLQDTYTDMCMARQKKEKNRCVTNIDDVTGFFGKKAFMIRADEAIREIQDSRKNAVFLHIYIKGNDIFDNRFSTQFETILLRKTAGLLKDAFPDSTAGRWEDDRLVLVTEEEKAENAIWRINKMLQVYYPNTMISVKAGCYVVDRKVQEFRLTDVMERAASACNSIIYDNDAYYSRYY
ncbi:MAG: hypothetical protein IJQ21_06545 [Lachnospiraceae bacterium]|nr:hypothetical protein [Lachnospiraceae bacterium]